LPAIDDWDPSTRLQYERELTGFYISAHPLQRFQDELPLLATATISSLPDLPDTQLVTLCGTVGGLKPITTKKGDSMGILTLEDLTGSVDVVIFSDLFLLAKDLLGHDRLIRITGVLETSDKGPKILGREVEDLPAIHQQLRQHLRLTIPIDTTSRESLQALHQVLTTHPGESHVSLRFVLPRGWEASTMILPTIRIDPSPPCLAQIRALIGETNIAYAPIPPRITSQPTTGATAQVMPTEQSA
jgi:DNA polymerase-3 subunit alpha